VNAPVPKLSVIVPVRNEKSFIRSCLESILSDAPEGGIEIILVDGMSDDGTAEEVRAIAAEDPRIKVMDNPSRFVPQAMNMGIKAAHAPFIGRIDGHCLVEPGYFSACLKRLETGDFDCVGGVLTNEGTTPAGRAVAAATSSSVGVGSARFRTGQGVESTVDTLAFGVYRKEVFEKIGNFDESLVRNQDDELNFRLTRSGGKILLVPSVRIRYFVRDSIKRLGRQYYQYGYWKWRVFRKHGRVASLRQLAPSIFLLALDISFLLALFTLAGKILFAGIVLPYLAVIFAEALRLAIRHKAPMFKIALGLTTLHFSYGFGLLHAIADTLFKGKDASKAAAPTSTSR
jgi:succinoglycan biosynthesis protein ExoA